MRGWWRWAIVRMEWRPAGLSVCLPLLIFPCTIKSRSSLLAPAHLGVPEKRAVKRLWFYERQIVDSGFYWYKRWWGGSGISWTTCKSFAPCSKQITTPVPHHSVFTGRMPFLPPIQQRESTEGMFGCHCYWFWIWLVYLNLWVKVVQMWPGLHIMLTFMEDKLWSVSVVCSVCEPVGSEGTNAFILLPCHRSSNFKASRGHLWSASVFASTGLHSLLFGFIT